MRILSGGGWLRRPEPGPIQESAQAGSGTARPHVLNFGQLSPEDEPSPPPFLNPPWAGTKNVKIGLPRSAISF
jgi:hypothetical protein